MMTPFLTRWLVTTLAVLLVSQIPGIGIGADGLGALLLAGLLLGFFNAFVRPLLLLLSLPLILFTMGLFIFVINAILLYAVAIVPGFRVESFGSALLGSILISLVSWVISIFFRGSDGRVRVITHHSDIKKAQGRVIE
ncbi:MAG TPA: phage holin family protein [Chthoniobacteraceae bacterium]|nr:phage holin family protein [Chthoniobacteraceae bacterium]